MFAPYTLSLHDALPICWVALDLFGGAFGDLLAEVQADDAVAGAHHESHVVLDDDHGDVEVLADRLEPAGELVDLAVAEAVDRLVQQQQPGTGRQRAGQLDPLEGAEREARSEEHTSELQSRENLVCRLLL